MLKKLTKVKLEILNLSIKELYGNEYIFIDLME